MIEIAQAQPAPFLFHGDPMQAQLAHCWPQFGPREPVFGIGAGGERGNLLIGKPAGDLADHLGAFGQGEIEIGGGAHRASFGLANLSLSGDYQGVSHS